MADELTCKKLAIEHCLRVSAGDLAGLLALYSPNVRFEDPVGTPVQIGIDALRVHAGAAIESGAREDAGVPVAAQDGASAAVPVTTTMNYLPWGPNLVAMGLIPAPTTMDALSNKRIRFHYVMEIRVGADGLIAEMRGFWGLSDAVVLETEPHHSRL